MVREILEEQGSALDDMSDETLMNLDHPLGPAYANYRAASHRLRLLKGWQSTVGPDSRVRAHWKQMGMVTGRMTCCDPNVQGLEGPCRAIVKAPPGRTLVVADYSQIQLRAIARITGAEDLRRALEEGRDLHRELAQRILGREDISLAEREFGKESFFKLLFGAREVRVPRKLGGAGVVERLRLHDVLSIYPGLRPWFDPFSRRPGGNLRTPYGRRVCTRGTATQATLLCCFAQGIEADGLKLALALLWERRAECPGAAPVATVHDEIVIEAPTVQATAAVNWLTACMTNAMRPALSPVPAGLVVPRIVKAWGG